jgi:ketosteroid isomerase-like protein
MKYLLFTIGVVLLLAPFCAPVPEAEPEPQVDIAADKEAITKVGQQLRDALNTDDVDGIMACLTDDHVTMAPDVPALDNPTSLRQWHEAHIQEVSIEISSRTQQIEVIGDWAIERWSVAITTTPKAGGDSVQKQEKGMWLWRRQGSGWKLAYSIWNFDAP